MTLEHLNDNWNIYWGDEANRSYWLKPDNAVVELLGKIDRTEVKNVLDLGCGVGRHSLLLAKANCNVTAVDSSDEALSVLRSQAQKEGIRMKIIDGNYAENIFPQKSFDFILSYNVLYHGYRKDFQQAILLVHQWLKPGGLFFFTCPTREDGNYGDGELVAPHTYRLLHSIHPGDIHYFSDEDDILDLLGEFKLVSKRVDQHYWDNKGVRQFSSYWQILAVKEQPELSLRRGE